MSLTLTNNPIVTIGGEVQNIFAGFLPVEFEFKREDLQVTLVEQGADDTILVNIPTDLTSYLSVGDSIYLFAIGDTINHEYNDTFDILEVTSTQIRLDGDFVEQASSSGSYINYLKNYFVEVELISPLNSNIKTLPFTLKDDGNNAGNITIDVSITNDKNIQNFELFLDENSDVDEDSRIKFKVNYREQWDQTNGTESYTTISDEIILVYATDQPDIEELINDFDEPEIYKGYPTGFVLTHSDQNQDDVAVNVYYDELDRNKYDINTDNSILQVTSNNNYGFLFAFLDSPNISWDSNTEYVRIHAEFGGIPDYDPAGYDPTGYKTT